MPSVRGERYMCPVYRAIETCPVYGEIETCPAYVEIDTCAHCMGR